MEPALLSIVFKAQYFVEPARRKPYVRMSCFLQQTPEDIRYSYSYAVDRSKTGNR